MRRIVDAASKVSMFMQALPQSVESAAMASEDLQSRTEAFISDIIPDAISKQRPVREVIQQSSVAFSYSAKGLDRTMKAAVIVLIHSQIDILVTELIALVVDCDRESWKERAIKNDKRQFDLAEFLENDRNVELDKAFSTYINSLGKRSLLNRSNLLMSQIPKQPAVEQLFKVARPASNLTIKMFDDARHSIVHIEPFADDLDNEVMAACGAMISHILFLLLNTSAYFGVDYSHIDLASFTSPFPDS